MPNPGFKVTPFTLFFDAEYLRSGTTYRQFQWNTNKDSHTPYNDTKRRAVSATAELLVLLAKGQCCSVIASVTFVNHVKTNKRIFKIFYHRTTILSVPNVMALFRRGPPKGGVERKGVWKMTISTNISLYLRNDARYSHSYYGRRIGNRTEAFEWYQYDFEWPLSQISRTRYYSTSNNSKAVQYIGL